MLGIPWMLLQDSLVTTCAESTVSIMSSIDRHQLLAFSDQNYKSNNTQQAVSGGMYSSFSQEESTVELLI